MSQKTENPTVKIVMDAFIGTVNSLNNEARRLMDSMPQAAEAEKAFHLNKLIRRWFASGGQLKRRL